MATLRTGMVWYWDLDDGTADPILDKVVSQGLDKEGTITTGSANGPGGRDCIVVGSQAGKYRTEGIARACDYEAGFTANIWIYRTTGTPTSSCIVFCQRDSTLLTGNEDYFQMAVFANTGTEDHGLVRDAADTARKAVSSAETTDVWQMLTFTDDGTTGTLYRNGSSVGTDTTSLSTFDTGAAAVAIGGISWAASTANDHFGRLALAGLWSRVLTGPEITLLYNGGSGRAYSETNVSAYILQLTEESMCGGFQTLRGGM